MIITPSSSSLPEITKAWLSAHPERDKPGLNREEREKLYKLTEDAAMLLNEQYEKHKNNPEILTQIFIGIQKGLNKPAELKVNMLGEWIAENSSHAEGPEMGFVGAYAPLHHISQLEADIKTAFSCPIELISKQAKTLSLHTKRKVKAVPNLYSYDHSLSVLANIDRCALFYIEKKKNQVKFYRIPPKNENSSTETENNTIFFIEEIQKLIFSHVPSIDPQTLTCTDVGSRQLALEELIEREKKDLINSEKELHLTLPNIDWNKTAESFIRLKYLSIAGWHPKIKDLEIKFTSVKALDLTNICDLEIFNHTLENFPSIERLGCFATVLSFEYDFCTNEIDNFSVLKNCPLLKTIAICGNFTSIEGLDNCTSLEKIILENCIELENIEELAKLPKLTHLTIFKAGISAINFHLPQLEYLYLDSQCIFQDFAFLKGSPKLETLVVGGDCLDADQLDQVKSIPTLKLIDFFASIIPGIYKCTSLKTLVLDTNLRAPLDLNGLNQCVSLETLGLENCIGADISVLSTHPSLKCLYIKNCDDIPKETMDSFQIKGIEVFFEETVKLPSSGIQLKKSTERT